MNIVVPLGGAGRRFANAGYDRPKPLVRVRGKEILRYLLDWVLFHKSDEDSVHVVYDPSLDDHGFAETIRRHYPEEEVRLVRMSVRPEEKTLKRGVESLPPEELEAFKARPMLVLRADAFYLGDLLSRFRDLPPGASGAAECGGDRPPCAVLFADVGRFLLLAETHPRTSEVAERMALEDGDRFVSIELRGGEVVFLGSPSEAVAYELEHDRDPVHHAFELDGLLIANDMGLEGGEEATRHALTRAVEEGAPISRVRKAIEFVRALNRPVTIVTRRGRRLADALLARTGLAREIHVARVVEAGPGCNPHLVATRGASGTPGGVFVMYAGSSVGARSAREAAADLTSRSSSAIVVAVGREARGRVEAGTADAAAEDFSRLDPSATAESLRIRAALFRAMGSASLLDVEVSERRLREGYGAEALEVTLVRPNGRERCVFKMGGGGGDPVARKLRLYRNEMRFYSTIRRALPEHVRDLVSPRCLAVVSQGSLEGVLMERLEGRVEVDLSLEASLPFAFAIVDRLAELHSATSSTDAEPLSSDSFSWSEFVRGRWPEFRRRWSGTSALTRSAEVEMEAAVRDFDEIEEALTRTGFRCLCHGGTGKGSVAFVRGEGEGESRPVFVDWQYVGAGKGVMDVAFLVVESLAPEHAAPVLDRYYEGLRGLPSCPYEDREAFDRDARLAMRYFPVFVAMWFGTLDATEEADLVDAMFPERFIGRLSNLLV